MRAATGDAHILWMELDGEIYSPKMALGRATFEAIARDIWNGAYAGICHAVYSYGARENGGSFCREVTQDLAARLAEISLSARGEVQPSVRAFLEAGGVDYCGRGAPSLNEPAGEPFEMTSPPDPVSRSRRASLRRKARVPSPEELRSQPQFKLPIPGGRAGEAAEESVDLLVESEQDEGAGVKSLSLRDTRPLAEQKASWDRFRSMVRSWKMRAADAAAQSGQLTSDESTADRRSARIG
jgi:hypothetical protein